MLSKTIKAHLKQHGIKAKARTSSGQQHEVIFVTVDASLIAKTRELVKAFENDVYAIFVQS